MKNRDVHKGLSQAGIRDFLANEHERAWSFGDVSSLEKEIEELQGKLIGAKKYQAVLQLIKSQGWHSWDVSDEVPYNEDTYFPFVGTKEEYDALLEAIKSEG